MFFVSQWKLSYNGIFALQKSVELVAKSSLIPAKQTVGPIISNCSCGNKDYSTTSSPLIRFDKLNLSSRVEVSEVISAERCFTNLTFFSADSENIKIISTDQGRFRADLLFFFLKTAVSERISFESELFSTDFLPLKTGYSAQINSESAVIFTHVDELFVGNSITR